MGRYTTLSDGDLVARYLGGQNGAFDELFGRYRSPIFTFLLRLVGNSTDAEDVFQDTFIKMIGALPRYTESDKFKSWLFGIANNSALDHLRHRARKPTTLTPSSNAVKSDSDLIERLPSNEPGPDDLMAADEDWCVLAEAVNLLPAEQRQVVALRQQEMTYQEIADVVGCSINTALGRMHYAVASLRKRLTQLEQIA